MATTFYYYGFVAGTALLPTSVAGLLSGSIPIFTFLGAVVFLREERPTAQMASGVALGFLGIVLSARPWNASADVPLAGVLWMLAGTSSVGASFVYARRFLSPLNLKPLTLATWQTGLAVVTLAALTDFRGIGAIAADTHALLSAVLGLGVVGTGGAFLIYYFIIGQLGPVRAAGATYIAPVVAVSIGAVVGERIASLELFALALILGGVVLIQTGKRKTSPEAIGHRRPRDGAGGVANGSDSLSRPLREGERSRGAPKPMRPAGPSASIRHEGRHDKRPQAEPHGAGLPRVRHGAADAVPSRHASTRHPAGSGAGSRASSTGSSAAAGWARASEGDRLPRGSDRGPARRSGGDEAGRSLAFDHEIAGRLGAAQEDHAGVDLALADAALVGHLHGARDLLGLARPAQPLRAGGGEAQCRPSWRLREPSSFPARRCCAGSW